MTAANFDPVARPYRWMEYLTFGPCLERCRFVQLGHLARAQRALVLGDGDGRFVARLLRVNPSLTVDVVDSSRSMLRELERRIPPEARPRIRLHHANALCWNPSGSYDLVVTHFFLDCFFPHQIEQLFERILPHLVPGAEWLVSEFAIAAAPVAQAVSKSIIGMLYLAFGLLTGLTVHSLPDYAASLRCRNFALSGEQSLLHGLLRSELWTYSGPVGDGSSGRDAWCRADCAMLPRGFI